MIAFNWLITNADGMPDDVFRFLKSRVDLNELGKEYTCTICYEEITGQQIYKCKCKIAVCNGCFLEWATTLVTEQINSENIEWRCPKSASEQSPLC